MGKALASGDDLERHTPGMKRLQLYTRPGCHLCQQLEEELVPVLLGRAEVERVNIDDDLELKKRYGLRIPVLAAEGGELCGYPLDVAVLEDYLSQDA